MKHARLSASGAHRWMACAGSVPLAEAHNLVSAGSFEAAAGTFAHHVAASCLAPVGNEPRRPEAWLGNQTIIDGFTVECDQEMVEGVQFYLDVIREDAKPGDKSTTEADITAALAKLHPDLGGNSDHIRYRPNTRQLRVFDFKYGEGVFVAPIGNKQMLTYALGAMLTMKDQVDEVVVTIVQPRIENEEGFTRDWTFPAIDILDFAAELVEAARAVKPGAPLTAGREQCKFCPARRICPELEKSHTEVVAAEFTGMQVYDRAKLASALAQIPLVKSRIKALEEFAYAEAERGAFGEADGWKLVAKRAMRKVVDEVGVKEWAVKHKVEPYEPTTLKSPAQLEKGLKKAVKDELAQYVESKSSGHVLVPLSDERPPVKLLTAADFPVAPSGVDPLLTFKG